jgi:hypothetical protein
VNVVDRGDEWLALPSNDYVGFHQSLLRKVKSESCNPSPDKGASTPSTTPESAGVSKPVAPNLLSAEECGIIQQGIMLHHHQTAYINIMGCFSSRLAAGWHDLDITAASLFYDLHDRSQDRTPWLSSPNGYRDFRSRFIKQSAQLGLDATLDEHISLKPLDSLKLIGKLSLRFP